MQITEDDWIRYKDKMAALSDRAAENLEMWLQVKGGYQNVSREQLTQYMYGLATYYGEATASLAAEMYDEVAALSGVAVPSAEVAETASYGEIAKAVNAVTRNITTNSNLGNVVVRYVKRAAEDTTLKNVKRDQKKGAQFAWVPAGDTCAFCMMLASNGWQNQSKNAMKNGHASHIHPNCDCTYAVRFDDKSNVKGYNPDKYKAMYQNAEGNTWNEKLNSMRRIQYQENKDRINAQKRANYAEKKKNYMMLKQDESESKVPKSMLKNYSDFEPLKLLKKDFDTLKELHKYALENRYEYGKIIYNEGETDLITSELFGKIALPVKQTEGTGLRIYHSHTNDTPPSSADFIPLTVDKVDRIAVVSNNGDTWVVDIADGYRPTEEELAEVTKNIVNELKEDLKNYPEYKEWSPEERNYMFIREKFFRISRHFKWKVLGGDINDEI